MKERIFRFKQFEVCHAKSAMKVGVDGVLIGAWANVGINKCRVLDVGCGCGLIALMVAQRNPKALITAIDIDNVSVEEARENVLHSPWAQRVNVVCRNFADVEGVFDYIISNPPFFCSGVDASQSLRTMARHSTVFLGPHALVARASELLADGGKLSFIAPHKDEQSIIEIIKEYPLTLLRVAYVAGKEGKEPKRVMVEVGKSFPSNMEVKFERINLEKISTDNQVRNYSQEYRELCKDFYLHF